MHAMNLEILIENLKEDLKNERKHMLFYLTNASTIIGLNRIEIKEFLLEEAASEMEHVEKFQNLILGLDGKIDEFSHNHFDIFEDPYKILDYALKMEIEVIYNYSRRIKEAQELKDHNGLWVEIFLESQIANSREDADQIKQMLKTIN
jgi:bacterioferritin (cytochrome b1)